MDGLPLYSLSGYFRTCGVVVKTVEERFLEKVELIPFHSCWEWVASKNAQGYGYFSILSKMYRAHRISYELFNGSISNSEIVMHTCDNPSCVNPAHLKLGTNNDNSIDKCNKNRQFKPKGSINPKAKLTVELVLSMRQDFKQGMKLWQLRKKYNLKYSQVQKIISNKSWTHI